MPMEYYKMNIPMGYTDGIIGENSITIVLTSK